MISEKLSPAMLETLCAIRGGMRRDYGEYMDSPTHCALERRGLIEFKGPAFGGYPTTWGLTTKGREFLESKEPTR